MHDLPASLLCLAAALLLFAEPLQFCSRRSACSSRVAVATLVHAELRTATTQARGLAAATTVAGTGWDGATATATKRLAGFTTSAVTTLRPRLVALPCGG